MKFKAKVTGQLDYAPVVEIEVEADSRDEARNKILDCEDKDVVTQIEDAIVRRILQEGQLIDVSVKDIEEA